MDDLYSQFSQDQTLLSTCRTTLVVTFHGLRSLDEFSDASRHALRVVRQLLLEIVGWFLDDLWVKDEKKRIGSSGEKSIKCFAVFKQQVSVKILLFRNDTQIRPRKIQVTRLFNQNYF